MIDSWYRWTPGIGWEYKYGSVGESKRAEQGDVPEAARQACIENPGQWADAKGETEAKG